MPPRLPVCPGVGPAELDKPARAERAEELRLRAKEFRVVARAPDTGAARIMLRYIRPSTAAPIIALRPSSSA